jgi:hypothetical protein
LLLIISNSLLTKGMLMLSTIMQSFLKMALAFQLTNHLLLIISNSLLTKGMLMLSTFMQSSFAQVMLFQ